MNDWKKLKARTKFIIIVAGMVLFSMGATLVDTATPSIDIPLVPDLSINGAEVPQIRPSVLLDNERIQDELVELFGIRSYQIALADRSYQAMEHGSAKALIDWMAEFYWNSPALRYQPESYDCDNFARTFVVIADLAGAEFFDGQLAIVRIYVSQKNSWAGVPAGGQHALVAFRTDKGWFVYESQGRSIIKAERYPNRSHVWKANGD